MCCIFFTIARGERILLIKISPAIGLFQLEIRENNNHGISVVAGGCSGGGGGGVRNIGGVSVCVYVDVCADVGFAGAVLQLLLSEMF